MRRDNEWFDNENESWEDYKISSRDVIFPQHEDKEPSAVITYKIGELVDTK